MTACSNGNESKVYHIMKLSDLVSLKQDSSVIFSAEKTVTSLQELRNDLELLTKRYDLENEQLNVINDTLRFVDNQITALDVVNNQKSLMLSKLAQDIEQRTKKFFAANYETEFVYNTAAGIRQHRTLYIPKHASPMLISRIGANLDWRYATLEIGCRDGEFTTHLVAGDPLYVVDAHQEFLDSTLNKFNEGYQRRIRPYLIKDHDFSSLPSSQFGFVFSWNHFNYLGLDTIKHCLQQVYQLLKPGGVMLFSYNNGDLPDSADYAEKYYMTYMPKTLLIPMCEMIGFDVIDSQDFTPAVSWIEIKKPGELTTVKAHQVLGTIKHD